MIRRKKRVPIGTFILWNYNAVVGWMLTRKVTKVPCVIYVHSDVSSSQTSLSSSLTPSSTAIHALNNVTKQQDPFTAKLSSPIFGIVARIQGTRGNGDNDKEQQSFVSSMAVPTFATIFSPNENNQSSDGNKLPTFLFGGSFQSKRKRGLEGALRHGPAFVVDDVLTYQACEKIISDVESLGFGNFDSGKNHHGALQLIVDQYLVDCLSQKLMPHINVQEVEEVRMEMMRATAQEDVQEQHARLFFCGLNRRWRIYRYDSSTNQTFAPHIDAAFPPSGLSDDKTSLLWSVAADTDDEIVSRLTVLIYLNDDFVGGETNFYRPSCSTHRIASVRPVTGSVLLFPQGVGERAVAYARKAWPLHEGAPVLSGRPKYVIRTDALFVTKNEELLLDNKLFRYDHLVREAFLPTSTVFTPQFLSHTAPLYNPHMGVENLGPFLYSFLRMTKSRQIVEIGAGYTSLWILQALKDNDEEIQRMRDLVMTGKCKLLDVDWTVSPERFSEPLESARLLCIDNCEHQKETATRASVVAKSLGLGSYFEFQRGDAFDLDLGIETVDILWCDFGVGSRMVEFMASAWRCIRPGGYLLCHSTITNENTRKWLESIRQRQPKEKTGIEPDEYVELSLLEPLKQYQNSVSIIQKRRCYNGNNFEEPIYSRHA